MDATATQAKQETAQKKTTIPAIRLKPGMYALGVHSEKGNMIFGPFKDEDEATQTVSTAGYGIHTLFGIGG